jgi:hypothetical protein
VAVPVQWSGLNILPIINLTVVQTCRRQGRSVIDFFEQAIKAMVNPDLQEPSLIPQLDLNPTLSMPSFFVNKL